MAIRANLKLDKVFEIIKKRHDAKIPSGLGQLVIVHPDTDPEHFARLQRHAVQVTVNDIIEEGCAYINPVPEYLLGAIIE